MWKHQYATLHLPAPKTCPEMGHERIFSWQQIGKTCSLWIWKIPTNRKKKYKIYIYITVPLPWIFKGDPMDFYSTADWRPLGSRVISPSGLEELIHVIHMNLFQWNISRSVSREPKKFIQLPHLCNAKLQLMTLCHWSHGVHCVWWCHETWRRKEWGFFEIGRAKTSNKNQHVLSAFSKKYM